MMTLSQAEDKIHKEIIRISKLEKLFVEMPNKPPTDGKPFVPAKGQPWSRVYIQYADSGVVGLGDKPCIRDYGIISIQCFAPKGTGMALVSELCDTWRKHLQSFIVDHLEVYLVHAPRNIQDNDFYANIVRAEFRVN